MKTYGCRQDGPGCSDGITRNDRDANIVCPGPPKVRSDEGDDPYDVKSPKAPTHEKRPGCCRFVPSKFFEEAYWDGFHGLAPIPHRVVVLSVLFREIAQKHIIVGTGPKMFQHPSWNCGGLFRRHAGSPFSSGKPFHKFIRDRRVSRTSRTPAPVIRK